ncbi:MAG: malate synthase G [Actinomycetota bacterium]|nr:malate synthase G [Actinomycetota bacterium]
MTTRVKVEDLSVDEVLYRFFEDEALPGSGIAPGAFWAALSGLVHDERGANDALLARRAELQEAIDAWHEAQRGSHDPAAYRAMLEEIGYLEGDVEDFSIETEGVDEEIGTIAGPQLVVPATNARYALNAANARWGSLYDALYGTNAIGSPPPSQGGYDPERGAAVIAWVRAFLDDVVPLEQGSHRSVTAYRVERGVLLAELEGGDRCGLANPAAFVGYRGDPAAPSAVILINHNLHLEIEIDRTHPIGATDPAGVSDVLAEAAVTAIIDLEDSIAAVDGEEKAGAYRTWLGLMRGDLVAHFEKGGRQMERRLAPDREALAPDGSPLRLRARALLLVRNVGHLMTTPAILDRDGREVPEGLLDALATVLIAQHDRSRPIEERNSRTGSVYIVKPKMHGSEEVAFADRVFARVEDALGLARNSVKMGLMEEERRTTLNLKACIKAAKGRICFINTGFLDRTGDEIHTSMRAGAMVRKAAMKSTRWLNAYEDHNVDVGLACGLPGRAQIGKGMWAAPEQMAEMLADKINHPLAGANCAWVPSPTAATLHATHYHRVDVADQQASLSGKQRTTLDDLLALPIADGVTFSAEEVRNEVANNAQGILGYVVRWVDQGVGCSKVPDINDVALMEDRATCRISSQHIANWLAHGIVDRESALQIFKEMAAVVDRQNAGDPAYVPMAPACDGFAFTAACNLALLGADQPSGYTEPILHAARRELKESAR